MDKRTSKLLRLRRFEQVDWDNLIEEIEDWETVVETL